MIIIIFIKKKLKILEIRFELIELNSLIPVHPTCLLDENYRLDITSPIAICPVCGNDMRKQWTVRTHPVSLQIGKPELVIHIKKCTECSFSIYPYEYRKFIPEFSCYAYDIIVTVGLLRLKNLNDSEIVEEFRNKYFLEIPKSTVSSLANKFYDYLAATHYTLSTDKIREYLIKEGGYILHIDGTCEAGTDMLFAVKDGISGIILASSKMKTENKKDLTSLLSECVKLYGKPLAVVSDMSINILNSVKDTVNHNIPHFICQFHLLENIGEKIFSKEYSTLGKLLRTAALKSQFQSLRGDLGTKNSDRLLSREEFLEFLKKPGRITKNKKTQIKRSLALSILKWINDYHSSLNGEYFPFSRPNYEFYKRCETVYKLLKNLFSKKIKKRKKYNCTTLETIYKKLDIFFNNGQLDSCVKKLENSAQIFNELRDYFRMLPEQGSPLCRQNVNIDRNIEGKISADDFIAELRKKYISDHHCTAINIINGYFIKYRNNLTEHWVINSNNKKTDVYRTNNVMEHFFGFFKQNLRKRIGCANLKRHIHLIHRDAPIVYNLLNEKYLEIIGGKSLNNICGMFVKVEKNARDRMKNRKEYTLSPAHIPFKVLRNQEFINDIFKIINIKFDSLFKVG